MIYHRENVTHIPLSELDFADGHDEQQWDELGWNERPAEAQAADADALEQQDSGPQEFCLVLDLANIRRALFVLDTARTMIDYLQTDGEVVGEMTISSVKYAKGETEYFIGLHP